MMGFIIWSIVGLLIVAIGVSALFSKKPAGFWANVKVEAVSDIKKYNHAVGILFILYGIIFILLGIPLLAGQNNSLVILSILGVVVETIAIMVVYSLVISKKYIVK